MSSEHGRIEPLPQDAAYKISGISNGAAREVIRRAYLEMMQKYHPDKVFNLADEYKGISEEIMKEIKHYFLSAMKTPLTTRGGGCLLLYIWTNLHFF
jgi:DnaJ-domain-containing protein 1